MAFTPLNFTKSWRNSADFPTTEQSETKVRDDMQCLYDEIKTYLNTILSPYFERGIDACVKSSELPVASADKLGCVKVGPGLKSVGGVLSLNGEDVIHADMGENDSEAATYVQNRIAWLVKEQDDLLQWTIADLEFTPISPEAGRGVAYSVAAPDADGDGNINFHALDYGREYLVAFIDNASNTAEEYLLYGIENSEGDICLGNEQVLNPDYEVVSGTEIRWKLRGECPLYIRMKEDELYVTVFGEHNDCSFIIIGQEQAGKILSKSLMPESVAIKPSWGEQNRERPGYIYDKPFFFAPAKSMFNKTISDWEAEGDVIKAHLPMSYYGGGLIPGATYAVTFDGQEYECEAKYESLLEGGFLPGAFLYIGDAKLMTDPSEAELPFFIVDKGWSYEVITDGSTSLPSQAEGVHVLEFAQKEYIKTLDEKFLPSSLTSRLDSIESDIEILYALISGLQQNG